MRPFPSIDLPRASAVTCSMFALAACFGSSAAPPDGERTQSASAAWSFTAMPGSIVSSWADKCLDVVGGLSVEGAAIDMADCNGSAGQQWSFTPIGEIRALGKCLALTDDGTGNGTAARLYTCTPYAPTPSVPQHPTTLWSISASGAITTQGKCLDVTGWGTASGTPIQVWDCAGSTNQKWRVQSAPVPIVTLNRNCMVPVSDTAGARVAVTTCPSSGATAWQVLPTGEIKSPAGLCLDVTNWGTANGTPIQLWTCNGLAPQAWTVSSAGELTAFGKCLESTGTASGSLLQLDDCTGDARQVWGLGLDAPETAPPAGNKIRPIAVTASSTYPGSPPANAIDGNPATAWNAGGYATRWIELDLGRPMPVERLRLLTAQSPAGPVSFTVAVGASHSSMRTVKTSNVAGADDVWLDVGAPWLGGDRMGNVRYVRITTTSSPSWVAWREIEAYGALEYFGYYGAGGGPRSTNIATVYTGTDVTAPATIAAEIAELSHAIQVQVNAGKKVMVAPDDFFVAGKPPTLAPDWDARITQVLVPAVQAYQDAVVAFYPLDEPYTAWNAVSVQDVQTLADGLHRRLGGKPIAVALNSTELSYVTKDQVAMFDWVGFDCYGPWDDCGGASMDTYIQRLRGLLSDQQRMIAYPWASGPTPDAWSGTDLSAQGIIVGQNLDLWNKEITADAKYVMIAPFLWEEFPYGDQKLGARYLPWVRERLFQLENAYLPTTTPQIFPSSVSSSADPAPPAGYQGVTPPKDPLDFAAFDRNEETAWSSGGFAPAWIQASFLGLTHVSSLHLDVAQLPAGHTHHDVLGLNAAGVWIPIATFDGTTSDRQTLRWSSATGVDVTAIRVVTSASPSWVQWREISIFR
jgi:hypothetical protein